ncbi:MAG: guanylate kinase, partial [Deltaproteobacteria bacterium]|nr:guanylate kinase [Deltaproteobacteria bacterium]
MTNATSASPRGHIFVIAAPSGTGKTTLCRHLLERDPRLRLSVSHTTRAIRSGEEDGVHYHFVSEKAFRDLDQCNAFLEHAAYGDNLYGTSWAAIEAPLEAGEDVVLEIEVQGAEQVKRRRP